MNSVCFCSVKARHFRTYIFPHLAEVHCGLEDVMLSLHTFVGSQRSGPKNVTAQNENVTRIFEHRFSFFKNNIFKYALDCLR